MKKNWPYFIVASFLNTLLVIGAFIEFKLRGMAVVDLSSGTGLPAWNEINLFQLAGGMFVLSFLLIVAIIGIKNLVSGIVTKLHAPQPPKGGEIQLHMPNVSFKL
jgi:hypothetical protein